MFEDRLVSYEKLKENYKLNLSEEEYIMQIADNALSLEIALSTKEAVLKSEDLRKLHWIMGQNIDTHAGVINGRRHLPFFNKQGKRDMVDGRRLTQELKLLHKQTKLLIKKAGDDKEEKIKAICIQAMRLFAIHPFNDANKRTVKMLLSHYLEKEFGLKPHQRPKWTEIPQKTINQAVRGNNIGPFARKVCEIYGIRYNPAKITEFEISSFKIYPDTGSEIFSDKEELKRSTIRHSKKVCSAEPVISVEELKEIGIKSSTLFRRNPVCDDLMNCYSTDSLLRKTKKYYETGQITEMQAKALTRKAILAIDGADEKSCDLATSKFLTTDINDVKKAVRFYEKEDFTVKTVSEIEKIKSLSSCIKKEQISSTLKM